MNDEELVTLTEDEEAAATVEETDNEETAAIEEDSNSSEWSSYFSRHINVFATLSITALLVIAIIAVILTGVYSSKYHHLQMENEANTYVRETYANNNYSIAAELYAVKPNGTEVVEDANGRLWEIPGLKITRHDRLLLEIKNSNEVVNVWVRAWAPTPAPTPEVTPAA